MQLGKFITFEGIDGAGKSTQIKAVSQWLMSHGIAHINTREPGGTPMAEKIRELVKANHAEGVDPVTETLLFNAARRQHVEKVIKPRLALNHTVLCDRFSDSTFAYQGAKGVSNFHLGALDAVTLETFNPDITFFIGISKDEFLKRRGANPDRLERELLERYEVTLSRFSLLINREPNRFVIIDGNLPESDVTAAIIRHLAKVYGVPTKLQ